MSKDCGEVLPWKYSKGDMKKVLFSQRMPAAPVIFYRFLKDNFEIQEVQG